MFLCRHGAHIENVLTTAGIAEVRQSAVAVAKAIVSEADSGKVVLVSSEQLRAIESANIYNSVFCDSHRLKSRDIIRLDPDPRLDVAVGLAEAIKAKHLPPYTPGGSCMQVWSEMTREQCSEIGVEFWGEVARRAGKVIIKIVRKENKFY